MVIYRFGIPTATMSTGGFVRLCSCEALPVTSYVRRCKGFQFRRPEPIIVKCMRFATAMPIPAVRDLKAMGTTKRTLYTEFLILLCAGRRAESAGAINRLWRRDHTLPANRSQAWNTDAEVYLLGFPWPGSGRV
jgi:hypothetical protein